METTTTTDGWQRTGETMVRVERLGSCAATVRVWRAGHWCALVKVRRRGGPMVARFEALRCGSQEGAIDMADAFVKLARETCS